MKIYILFVFTIFIIVSCINKKNIDPEIKAFLGSTIITTDSLTTSIQSHYSDKDYIMLIYFTSEDCAPCVLEKVNLLKTYKNEFSKFRTGIILMIQDCNKNDDVKFIMKEMGIDYPLVFDYKESFKSKNKAMDKNICQTFIMNKQNKVIWIGSPIQNEKSLTLYRKMMKKLIR